MSRRPETVSVIRIPNEDLQAFLERLFGACGVPPANTERVVHHVMAADLRGAYSHGCVHVPWYVESLLDRGVDPAGTPSVAEDHGAALVVDGENALGHLAVDFAMHQAVARAVTTGVAVASVGRSNHCGALGSYTLIAVERDMVGIVMTHAMPTMAPVGGLDRVVGVNPLAIGIPSLKVPFVLDVSFGSVARARIAVRAEEGLPLEPGWATDADGAPTLDALVALGGLITPIGGHKGVGLALAVGILSSVLSGGAYGTELGDLMRGATAGRDGQLVIALNVAAFEDPEHFKRRVDGLTTEIHRSRRIRGVDRLFVPGEQAAETETRYRAEGVPLTAGTIRRLSEVSARLGVATPFP